MRLRTYRGRLSRAPSSDVEDKSVLHWKQRCWPRLPRVPCVRLVAQSRPTLCDPTDCSSSDCPVHGDSPGKHTGVGCHAFLQGIFLTQGLNPGLLRCRQILYQLSYQEHPMRGYQCFRFYQVDNYDVINRCFAFFFPPLLTCFAF